MTVERCQEELEIWKKVADSSNMMRLRSYYMMGQLYSMIDKKDKDIFIKITGKTKKIVLPTSIWLTMIWFWLIQHSDMSLYHFARYEDLSQDFEPSWMVSWTRIRTSTSPSRSG